MAQKTWYIEAEAPSEYRVGGGSKRKIYTRRRFPAADHGHRISVEPVERSAADAKSFLAAERRQSEEVLAGSEVAVKLAGRDGRRVDSKGRIESSDRSDEHGGACRRCVSTTASF